MLVSRFTYLLLWPGYNVLASPPTSSLQTRSAPGNTVQDVYESIRQGLAIANLEKRYENKSEINLARRWTDATLLHVEVGTQSSENGGNSSVEINASIEVTCTTCYVRGLATAQITIGDGFDMGIAYNATAESVRQNVGQLASDISNYLDNYTDSVLTNVGDGFDWSDFDLPTFPYQFDLSVPPMPDCHLRFQFDDLELYMAVDTVLSAGATYELNLYSSNTPAGFAVGPVQFGFVVQVDLILAIDGEIDISSGIHIMLDDGVTMDLDLFGNNVTDLVVNGGKFEFLPVTVQSGGVVISAALRVGVHCGVEVGTPPSTDFSAIDEMRTGIEVAVFANVAEFVTNVTYAPEDEECEMKVVQAFNFAVGAIAGASMVVDLHGLDPQTWGPVPETSTAVYTTTLAEVCAIKGTPTPTQASITAVGEKQDDLTTTTISTTLMTTGVSCTITGIAACPASAQVSTKATTVKPLVTAVPSGVEATFPESVFEGVQSPITFGSHAKSIKATSGQPTAYVEPNHESPTDIHDDALDGQIQGVNIKLIIGLSVGLGVPILLAALAAVWVFQRRNKRTADETAAAAMLPNFHVQDVGHTDDPECSKQAGVTVSETR